MYIDVRGSCARLCEHGSYCFFGGPAQDGVWGPDEAKLQARGVLNDLPPLDRETFEDLMKAIGMHGDRCAAAIGFEVQDVLFTSVN